MLSSDCKGVAVEGACAAGGDEREPGAQEYSPQYRAAESGEEKQPQPDIQQWYDGSCYEGEFVDGLKHGTGRYTWSTGEVSKV